MRSKFLLTGAAAAVLVGLATPANAASSGDTAVTFSVPSGALSITVPVSASFSPVAPGNTASGTLGTVTVTDSRALLSASWTTSVTSTDFKTGSGTAAETIAKNSASYWSGPGGPSQGNGTFTPGQATAAAKQSLSTSVTAYSLSGNVGNNTAIWTPTLVVSVPSSAVAGTYTGTVTHSVA